MLSSSEPDLMILVYYDEPRSVYQSDREVFGRFAYFAITTSGLLLECWRPRLGEADQDVIDALWDLLDLLDPLPVPEPVQARAA